MGGGRRSLLGEGIIRHTSSMEHPLYVECGLAQRQVSLQWGSRGKDPASRLVMRIHQCSSRIIFSGSAMALPTDAVRIFTVVVCSLQPLN